MINTTDILIFGLLPVIIVSYIYLVWWFVKGRKKDTKSYDKGSDCELKESVRPLKESSIAKLGHKILLHFLEREQKLLLTLELGNFPNEKEIVEKNITIIKQFIQIKERTNIYNDIQDKFGEDLLYLQTESKIKNNCNKCSQPFLQNDLFCGNCGIQTT